MPNMCAKLSVSLFTLFCTVGLLGGCNKADPTASGPDSTSSASADDQDQATLKYNAYVDAANGIDPSFGKTLDSYREYIIPRLKNKDSLKDYDIENDSTINRTLAALQKAIALPGPKTDIDPAAQVFAQALQTLAPISHELNIYGESRAYLADHGEKARAKNDAYLAALEKVAQTEAVFTAAVERYDRVRTQAQFQKAKKGSPDYYRLGIIIHARNSVDKMVPLYEHYQDENGRKAVEAELNQVQALFDEYSTTGAGCPFVKSSVTDYLATGRTILDDMRSGRYAEKYRNARNSSFESMNFSREYPEEFMQKFNYMIARFNSGQC